jgi:hypothetical protein
MIRIGWKPGDVDSRKAYKKVFDALQHGTVHTTRLLINTTTFYRDVWHSGVYSLEHSLFTVHKQ